MYSYESLEFAHGHVCTCQVSSSLLKKGVNTLNFERFNKQQSVTDTPSLHFTSLPNTLPKMSPEETRDLIETLRNQLGQDDHSPERYILDALFEMANSPPTTPESARDRIRRCQQIRECNQEISKLREAQEEARNQVS